MCDQPINDEPLIFSQKALDKLLCRHRRSLQRTIATQAARISELEQQLGIPPQPMNTPLVPYPTQDVAELKGVNHV